ncbi:agmatine deiminase family protein [Oligoflexus tunisiensis]|uniref:agmatine deiminase family protein n=1 Tax=Oligoflexus tunisiensis TaxID=708132 RepID=UPI00114CEEE9|nr:agmatine deiminase family protein [Oligoflexus tunisiensis]
MKKKLLLPATCLLAIAAVLGYQNWAPQKIQISSFKFEKTIQPRPLAEYEPMFGVAVSEQVLFRESGIELVRAMLAAKAKVYIFMTAGFKEQVEELFTEKKPFKADELKSITRVELEHESPWLRDFFPIPVLRAYPFIPPTPSFVDFVYRDGSSYDDAAIHQFALAINSSVEHLPIVMDGGNFMTNGETCIVSEEMSDDPESNRPKDPNFSISDHVADIFQLALGCRKTRVVSQIPHPHVDMFLKFVNRNTILVNEIQDRAMDLLDDADPDSKVKIPKIKSELDRIAKDLSKTFRVVRVPMPLPVYDIFFTYANSVIVNDTVIIPSYKNPDPSRGTYPDQHFYASYEEEVRKAYQEVGLKTVFLKADDLIKDGGAFHCVTFHLPDLEAIVPESSHLAAKPKP